MASQANESGQEKQHGGNNGTITKSCENGGWDKTTSSCTRDEDAKQHYNKHPS